MLPSATEIVHALGLTDDLIGRSHECDYPPHVLELPAVTYAYIDSQASSRIVDLAVKKRAQQGLSLYGIHKDQIRKLDPDFIVTQTQCDLCAVSLRDVQTFLKDDVGVSAELLVLALNVLNDVWQDIRNAGASFGVSERAESVVDKLAARLSAVKRKSQSLPSFSVAIIEWTAPLMAAGNWTPELVAIAGGHDVFGRDGVHSASIQPADLQKTNPDFIIVAPCGFDLRRTEREIRSLTRQESWAGLNAVQKGQVYAVDGNAFFNRPGPRLVESAEILAEILHPESFDFGHCASAWRQCPRPI